MIPSAGGASDATRRSFLKTTAATVAGLGISTVVTPSVHAAGSDAIKVALVGCGNRGVGAVMQALRTEGNVELWALADAFGDRVDSCLLRCRRQVTRDAADTGAGKKIEAEQINVPKERQFVGLDAYRKVIESGVDVVILAGPPGYRPLHFEHAIKSGKHVFMEKPVATDPVGIRRVLAAAEEAKKKNLKVGVGLQRRHQSTYIEAIDRIKGGEIGDLIALRCYWNGGPPAKSPYPRGSLSELEFQVRNWYFFDWLSGDHICEQHVHNIDVCNWIKGAHPVAAQGMGGRQVRIGKDFGNIFDHHAVEYTFADGTKMFSQCRQIPGTATLIAESADCTRGTANLSAMNVELLVGNQRKWKSSTGGKASANSGYQEEHNALFDAIRTDKPFNEAEYAATSTMTAILGRMATYSGQVVTWDQAMQLDTPTPIDAETWTAATPSKPNADGLYAIAIPGVTKFA